MNLIEAAFDEKFVIMDKTTTPDGEGGVVTTYTDGAEFTAAVTLDTSTEARVAEQQGVKSLYTVTTKKSVVLQYHDVFRRLRDGKIFRATSDGDDKASPKTSKLNIRQVTAEEFKP